MKFISATVLSALLCAEAALARRHSAATRRQVTKEHATVESNWGGAILEGSGFTAVSAVANVPRGTGGSSAAASAWVGIDGDSCETAILQTGFDWYGDGTYDAWYEWYPEFACKF